MDIGTMIGAGLCLIAAYLWYKSITNKGYHFKYESHELYPNSCYSSWQVTRADKTKFNLKVIHDKAGYMYMDGVANLDKKEYITLADLSVGPYDGVFHQEIHRKFVWDYLKQKELYL